MSECPRFRFKTTFRNAYEADLALLRIQADPDRSRGEKVPQQSYACTHCPGWHLTSQAPKQ